MNPNREELLFQLALLKPTAERAEFLNRECGDDKVLRARLEDLLAAHEQSEGVLADPAPAANRTMKIEFAELPDETIGQKIGRYKILEKIGEGGCGVVYVAEQTEPVRRRVALKVIKLGMDTKQVVARFEAERQALAMMDHPNIAKVLDAGTTDTGRPYFIMELVRGIRITEYCDQNKLATRERLELFIKICQAIQHAHQKGIIHRDIKPSNILVTLHDGVPVPKVIDFGIAKATEGRLTDATVYTQLHQFVGTPAYMSPEQAEMSGLDIDTRSDIYSLGVLLYELLTGKTPFDAKELMSLGIDGMRKTIREKEPVRPSTKVATLQGEELSTTATRHAVEAPKLVSQLRGDLDWIVMKCLEKDRTRRYETANGLAVDIKRHLNNETVVARPPSSTYRFHKLVRRNKLAFAAAGAVVGALFFGIVATTWQAIRATHARKEALAAQANESIQREKAEANERQAIDAEARETKLRKQAQADELSARQRAYASDMNVAQEALAGSNLGRAVELLERQRPLQGQQDLRGWEWRYLWQQTRSDALFTLCRKPTEIGAVTVSADGSLLAAGMVHKGGISVYDLNSHREIANLSSDKGVSHAVFSRTGSLLAFAADQAFSSDNYRSTVRLWNAATRKIVAELPLENCAGLGISQDGKTLVTSTYMGQISLWRIPEMTQLTNYPCEQVGEWAGTGFAVASDFSLAAYGAKGGLLRVIDLRSGKELWSVVAAKDRLTALAFSPDGKTLASAAGFSESDIRLWDVATGAEAIPPLTGHKSWVGSLVFSADGKKLFSCSADQTIRVWDLAGRKCLDVLRGHHLEVWRLALSQNEKTLFSGSKDGEVCAWDVSVTHPHREVITWPGNIINWQFAPDSRSILTVDTAGQVVRWSGAGFQDKVLLLTVPKDLNHFRNYCFNPDCLSLAVGSTNGTVAIWDLLHCKLQREIKLGQGFVTPAGFLAGAHHLICGLDEENRMSEWDLDLNREIQRWPEVPSMSGFCLSPDEQLAVAIEWEGGGVARNITTHSDTNLPLAVLEGGQPAFSPNGRHFAVASSLGFLRVFETSNWQEEATLHGYSKSVTSAAFSPDNQRLATGTGDSDNAVKLWDVDSWQDVFKLAGEGSIFFVTSFSPDGNSIGTVSFDGFLHVWQAPSLDEIRAAEAKEKSESQIAENPPKNGNNQ
jgi:WD40 repeat protein/serine/threonine protein kinase